MLEYLTKFTVFLFLFNSFVYAKDNVAFSFGIKGSLGEHKEQVFENGYILSLLQWPLFPAFACNFVVDVYFPYFHFSNDINIAFPSKLGNMKDSDYTATKENKQTLFSQHIAYLKEDFSIKSLIGIPFKCFSNLGNKALLIFEPVFGIYFSRIMWHARGGYTQYWGVDGSYFWHPSWSKIPYNGEGVEYLKTSFFPFVEFDIKLVLKEQWYTSVNFLFSPVMMASSRDIHFDVKRVYLDSFSIPGFVFETKGEVEYRIMKSISIYANISFFSSYNKHGKTEIIRYDNGEKLASFPTGSAGIDAKILSILIGTRFWF